MDDPRAVAGSLLALGCLLFLTGAANPRLFAVWTASEEIGLPIIAAHPTAWRSTAVLMAAGTAASAAGVVVLAADLAVPLGLAAAVVYVLAAVMLLGMLASRLVLTPAAARGFVEGRPDPGYPATARWAAGLFACFTVLVAIALVAIGLVLLGAGGPVIPAWVAIVLGAVVGGGFLFLGDMPPFVAFLPTGLLGIVLLLTR